MSALVHMPYSPPTILPQCQSQWPPTSPSNLSLPKPQINHTTSNITYLLPPKMPILLHAPPHLLPNQPPYRHTPKQYAINRHAANPHIHKAWREVIACRAEGSPSLFIATECLVRGFRGCEVMGFGEEGGMGGVQAGEGACGEDALARHCGVPALGARDRFLLVF